MLEQKAADEYRQRKPALVHRCGKPGSCEGDRGSINLEHALDIPLFIELAQPLVDADWVGGFTRLLVSRAIRWLISLDVFSGTRSTVVGIMMFLFEGKTALQS